MKKSLTFFLLFLSIGCRADTLATMNIDNENWIVFFDDGMKKGLCGLNNVWLAAKFVHVDSIDSRLGHVLMPGENPMEPSPNYGTIALCWKNQGATIVYKQLSIYDRQITSIPKPEWLHGQDLTKETAHLILKSPLEETPKPVRTEQEQKAIDDSVKAITKGMEQFQQLWEKQLTDKSMCKVPDGFTPAQWAEKGQRDFMRGADEDKQKKAEIRLDYTLSSEEKEAYQKFYDAKLDFEAKGLQFMQNIQFNCVR